MATSEFPDGLPDKQYAVVFALYPGDPSFYTIVERDSESGGAPAGSPTVVAWLAPGERYYVERRNATESFEYYRFKHSGFGYDAGTATSWYRARAVPWNGSIPNIPREALLDLDLALDDADGTVDITANGSLRVASISWDYSTSSYPSSPSTSVDADANGDVTVTDAFTLSAGETGYVTVEFFDQTSSGGNSLGTLRASVTRPTTGTSDPSVSGAVVLNGDFENDTDGAYWGQDATKVAVETVSPASGSKSLKLTSQVGNDTIAHQVVSGAGLSDASTVAKRRLIQVEPGEAFELRGYAEGLSDRSASYIAVEYDADKSQTGTTSIISVTSSTTRTEAYTVPDSVRYINWACYVGPDASGPRTFLFDNFTAKRIDTTVTGTPDGISSGGTHHLDTSDTTPDSSGGTEGSDPGKFYWGDDTWKLVTPDGNKYYVPGGSITLVSLDGTASNTARSMSYVAQDTSRFTNLADSDYRNIVGVRKSRSAGWQYLGDDGWYDFTPDDGDVLLADPTLTINGVAV